MQEKEQQQTIEPVNQQQEQKIDKFYWDKKDTYTDQDIAEIIKQHSQYKTKQMASEIDNKVNEIVNLKQAESTIGQAPAEYQGVIRDLWTSGKFKSVDEIKNSYGSLWEPKKQIVTIDDAFKQGTSVVDAKSEAMLEAEDKKNYQRVKEGKAKDLDPKEKTRLILKFENLK